jgi:membrane-associated protease RseP (regulator of RpoE activity)
MRFSAALLALAVVLWSHPALAQTTPPILGNPAPQTGSNGSPVTMNDCSFIYRVQDFVRRVHRLKIEFTNESNKTADLVTFNVTSDIGGATIRDVGKYEAGAEVSHEYRQFYNVVMPDLQENLHCTVQAVHFTDGTTWAAGVAPVETQGTDHILGVAFVDQVGGVFVKFVAPGSIGDAAGLHQGDRVVSIGSNSISNLADLEELLKMTAPTSTIPMTVDRGGSTVNLTIKPAPR